MKLRFRERGPSPELRKRLTILGLVFLFSLIIFYLLFNLRLPQSGTHMSQSSLPVLSVVKEGENINRMRAYTQSMDGTYMRGSVSPLGTDRSLRLNVDAKGKRLRGLSYELRSGDGQQLLASGERSNLPETGGEASIQFPDSLEEGVEYLLTLHLHLHERGKEDLYYYTRLLMPQEANEQELLRFARDFHQKAFSGQASDLSGYLNNAGQPSGDRDLSEVNLDSGVMQLGYDGLALEEVGQADFSYTDINSSYSMMEAHFLLKNEQNGQTRYFQLKEYFRLRYALSRVYVMDYQRTMETIQTQGSVQAEQNQLNLGLGNRKLNYMANEMGTFIHFVSAGDLFAYDEQKRDLKRIFSFRNAQDPTEIRGNDDNHEIKLLKVDETGSLDFVVYGYMSAGSHEGLVGIDLYHYDAVTEQLQEKGFVETSNSYQVLKASFSDLTYVSGNRNFYILVGGSLTRINLNQGRSSERIGNLKLGQYAISQSGRYFAYTDQPGSSDRIHILDLETEKTEDLSAASQESLRPMAYMGEDLVYGVIRQSDQAKDAAGNAINPMYQVKIYSPREKKELMDYQKDGYYVTDSSLQGETLVLTRLQRVGGAYVPVDPDSIRNSLSRGTENVLVRRREDERWGTVTALTLSTLSNLEEGSQNLDYTDVSMHLSSRHSSVQADPSHQGIAYFVYVGSQINLATDRITDAIGRADQEMGLVVDNQQHYIWRRNRRPYIGALGSLQVNEGDRNADSSTQAISAILSREGKSTRVSDPSNAGKQPVQILQEKLTDSLVLNLTGAKLSQVFYYVSQGSPVYALLPGNEAVLIVGYSADTVRYLRAGSSQPQAANLDAMQRQFEAAGNVFLSYVDAK